MNKDSGTYVRILKKWGNTPSAIGTSQINPPDTSES
jgi:hypothetical protein